MNLNDALLADWRDKALRLEAEVRHAVVGQDRAIRLINIAVFARGHVLLEGDVGVGKTTLLRAVARAIGGAYERIEGTIDLMPNDLVYHTYISEELASLRSKPARCSSSGERSVGLLLQRDQPRTPAGAIAAAAGDGRAQRQRLQP